MRTLWRRLVPCSIAGQITAFVVAALVLAQVLVMATVITFRASGLFTHPASSFAGRVEALVRAIDAEPAATRDRAIRSAVALLGGGGALPAAPIRTTSSSNPGVIALIDMLGAAFEDRGRVMLIKRGDPAKPDELQLGVELNDGRVFAIPLPPESQRPPITPFIWLMVSVGTTLTVLSLWAARQITAPLTRFSRAAERFGLSLAGEPLDERGPAEIRQINASFNRMRDRIRRLIDDRTRMLAAISHDLRTPLTRLRLRVETMEDAETREQALADIRSIETMTHSALEYLRGESRGLKRDAVDLSSLLQTVCSEFADLGPDVTYDGPRHAPIRCDADLIARAVANLVDNATRHGDKVVVRLLARPDGVVIEVADDGPGLGDEQKQQAFEPFYRGDPARAPRDHGGFGLGLSIAKAIVEDHGGEIALDDAKSTGLIVRIALPAGRTNIRDEDKSFAAPGIA